MRRIVYYVACSLDGYIAGPKGDSSMFVKKGSVSERYREDLEAFDTVIMCRQTYEFGYGYGLEPGQPTCEGKKHYIFSNSLFFERHHPDVFVMAPDEEHVEALKAEGDSDIYLCGGGHFAGWLLEKGLIDAVKLRLNPVVLGSGTRLFGQSPASAKLRLVSSVPCDGGVHINDYQVLQEPPTNPGS